MIFMEIQDEFIHGLRQKTNVQTVTNFTTKRARQIVVKLTTKLTKAQSFIQPGPPLLCAIVNFVVRFTNYLGVRRARGGTLDVRRGGPFYWRAKALPRPVGRSWFGAALGR